MRMRVLTGATAGGGTYSSDSTANREVFAYIAWLLAKDRIRNGRQEEGARKRILGQWDGVLTPQ